MAGQEVWALFLSIGSTVGAVLSLSQFPVAIRYAATGFAYNVAYALFGGTAPYVSTWLVTASGNVLSPAIYLTVVAFVCALPTALFGLRPVTAGAGRVGTGAVNDSHGGV